MARSRSPLSVSADGASSSLRACASPSAVDRIAVDGVVLAHIIEQGGECREHAKVLRNKPQKAGIGGFRAESYAKDPFLRVLTVYFCRPAAATQTAQCAKHDFSSWLIDRGSQ
jgi:hypothetical protein